MLRTEMTKIESYDYRRSTVNRGGGHVPVLFIVGHFRNQGLVTGDPGIGEMDSQLSLKMFNQRWRPFELRFQCASRFPNYFAGPLGHKEPRRFREPKECIAQRVVHQNAHVQNNR